MLELSMAAPHTQQKPSVGLNEFNCFTYRHSDFRMISVEFILPAEVINVLSVLQSVRFLRRLAVRCP
jgi:hypothetical protein